MRWIVFLFLIAGIPALGWGEVNIIDIPTAYPMQKNTYQINFRFYGEGGLLITGRAGLTEKVTIGASYGGRGIIGQEEVEGNPEPAFEFKYSLAEEGEKVPFSLSFGYQGQGYGRYYQQKEEVEEDGETYPIKTGYNFYRTNSTGFYLVLSKNWEKIRLHLGINHSFEDDPGGADLSLFGGVEAGITPEITWKLEYNDIFHKKVKYSKIFEGTFTQDKTFRKAGGELNTGFVWRCTPNLWLEFDFRDLTGVYSSSGDRVFQVSYQGTF